MRNNKHKVRLGKQEVRRGEMKEKKIMKTLDLSFSEFFQEASSKPKYWRIGSNWITLIYI